MAQAQREWFEKDYYKVLGVTDSSTEKDITRAYRKLAKKYHPDANPGSEERFKDISAAYDVIGDPDKRKEYDDVRRLGPLGGAGSPFGNGAGGFNSTTFRVEDMGDLLGGLFGGARGRSRPSQTSAGPRRGADLEAELHLSFGDAVAGASTTVNVTSDAACTNCGGTGAAPGTAPVICSACGGRGVRDDNQGLFSFSQPCRECRGTGMRVETPCADCRGSGLVHRARQVKIGVPPGVEDGQRIRRKGGGGAGANGGPSGDLFVIVRVGRHELFGRKGRADLTIGVPITYPEAVLGADVTVPTLDAPVTLRIPPGTRSGRVFRVKGRGAPLPTGAGDLLVTVEVAVPQGVDGDEREAIEALAAVSTESPRKHLGV